MCRDVAGRVDESVGGICYIDNCSRLIEVDRDTRDRMRLNDVLPW